MVKFTTMYVHHDSKIAVHISQIGCVDIKVEAIFTGRRDTHVLTFVIDVLYTGVPEVEGLHISQGTMSLRFPKPVVSEWRLGVRDAQVGHRAGGVVQPVVPVVAAALRHWPLVGARELGKVAQVDDPSRKNTDRSLC